jgi:hypothetical protein
MYFFLSSLNPSEMAKRLFAFVEGLTKVWRDLRNQKKKYISHIFIKKYKIVMKIIKNHGYVLFFLKSLRDG